MRAVATSTRRDRAEAQLAQQGLLQRFAALVGGNEVERGKPEPDIFLLAASRLSVAPEDCVVLEDSEPGVRAALAAGMMPIMVPDMHAPSPSLLARAPLVLPVAARGPRAPGAASTLICARSIFIAGANAKPVPGGRKRRPAGSRRVGARQHKTSLAAPPATAGATHGHWLGTGPCDCDALRERDGYHPCAGRAVRQRANLPPSARCVRRAVGSRVLTARCAANHAPDDMVGGS